MTYVNLDNARTLIGYVEGIQARRAEHIVYVDRGEYSRQGEYERWVRVLTNIAVDTTPVTAVREIASCIAAMLADDEPYSLQWVLTTANGYDIENTGIEFTFNFVPRDSAVNLAVKSHKFN